MTPHFTPHSHSSSHSMWPALLHFVFSCLLSLCLGAAWRPSMAQAGATPAVQTDQDARPLVVGQPIERELAGGQSHSYRITLAAGQYLKVVVERRGIDVVAGLSGPDGNSIMINPITGTQREPLSCVAKTDGDYRLFVSPLMRANDATSGRYEVRIAELRTATEQDRDIEEASSLLNKARGQVRFRNYGEAISLAERALAIYEKALGPDNLDVANPLTELAFLYADKGDFAKAEPLYQRTLAIRKKALGIEHIAVAESLSALAHLDLEKGDYAKAEPLLQRALEIKEKALGNEDLRVAISLESLASLYVNKGDFNKAERLYRRALSIYENSRGLGSRIDFTIINLAMICNDNGDYAEAESLYRRSMEILEKGKYFNNPYVAKLFDKLGTLYWAREETAQAVVNLRRAAEISESSLNEYITIGSGRVKVAELSQFAGQTNRIISLRLHSANDNPEALELAITTILRRKGRALDAMSGSIGALRRRGNPEDQALLNQLKEIRSQLARLALDGPQGTTPAEHQAMAKNLEEQAEKLEETISSQIRASVAQSPSVTIAAVQAAIPDRSALVEFFVYRPFNPKAKFREAFGAPRYIAYVLGHEGKVSWVELGEAKAIDEPIDKLRLALRDPKRRDVKRLARDVDRLVMDPLRPLLRSSRRVILSPDGALNLVPFAALVDRGGHYLVKHYEFSYLTSGRDLLRSQAPRLGSRSAMVVANPDFGESASDGVEGSRGIKLKYQAPPPDSGGESAILSDAFFPPLAGTADEAKALKSMLPDATVLTGAQATEAEIKRATNPGILHIATHGFFLPDVARLNETRVHMLDDYLPVMGRIENQLLRSGLALAGANLRKHSPGQEDDGVLTAAEASALDLWGTKLVVLSACDTGVGEVRNGEGVYGLRRALALAGAETQVMSLWPVSDKATRDLMIEYYKRLLGGSGRSQALREAQLRMLAGGMRASDGSSRILTQRERQTETQRTKDYSHPYYWACFIQSGEWANLDGKR